MQFINCNIQKLRFSQNAANFVHVFKSIVTLINISIVSIVENFSKKIMDHVYES